SLQRDEPLDYAPCLVSIKADWQHCTRPGRRVATHRPRPQSGSLPHPCPSPLGGLPGKKSRSASRPLARLGHAHGPLHRSPFSEGPCRRPARAAHRSPRPRNPSRLVVPSPQASLRAFGVSFLLQHSLDFVLFFCTLTSASTWESLP